MAFVIGLLPMLGGLLSQQTLAANDATVVGDDCDRDGLAAAILAASGTTDANAGTVTFDCEQSMLVFDEQIEVNGAVIIDGSNSGNPIALDGGYGPSVPGSSRIFYVNDDAHLTLQHITLQHGYAEDAGAILNYGELTVEHAQFIGNAAHEYGGAILNTGIASISDSRFADNQAIGPIGYQGYGGAIENEGYGTLTITRSSFINNDAEFGGAISVWNGSAEITASTFSDNTADGAGSTINARGELTIRWSTIVQPPDTDVAIAARNAFADLTFEGVIFGGEGRHCRAISTPPISESYSIANDTSCGLDPANGSQQGDGLDLGLADELTTTEINGVPQSYYAVTDDSIANNAGGSACADTLDQLGTTRPQDDLCDIGAIELGDYQPVDLCANRWTGDLRIPAWDRCRPTELMLSLPVEEPLTICANRWTGDARYAELARCWSTEQMFEVLGHDEIPICVNRWTGAVRVQMANQRCATTEWSDRL